MADTTEVRGRVTADEVNLDRFHNRISKVCAFVAATLLWGAASAPAQTSYTVTDLGTLGGSFSVASGINNGGQVVGFSPLSDGAPSHAFLYSGSQMRDLGTLGGSQSFASGINNRGQIVGGFSVSSVATHAFLYSGGQMRDLGTLGGSFSVANGINNGGQVVGQSSLSGGTQAFPHAFLYSGGQMRDLGTLGGSYSQAFAINDPGQIVGLSSLVIGPKKPSHAFLYSGGQMQDLNNLLPSNSGWIVTQAVSINDAGQIACSGSNGQATHALLLTPVSQ